MTDPQSQARAAAEKLTGAGRRAVPGYEGRYEIDTDGNIYSLARTFNRINRGRKQTVRVPARTLAQCLSRKGYPFVILHKDGKAKTREVHRLVCRAFHGEPPFPDAEATHDNGVRHDPRAENLEWKTRSQNHADKRRHGTHLTGAAVPNSKLTAEQAREICRRALCGEGGRPLGREFGVDEAAIRKIRDGKMWAAHPPSRPRHSPRNEGAEDMSKFYAFMAGACFVGAWAIPISERFGIPSSAHAIGLWGALLVLSAAFMRLSYVDDQT